MQTQVIPYLRELVKGGHELTLLTFEPGEVDEAAVLESLNADGIEWRWLKYHKRPSVPATLFDIANGARFIRKLANEQAFDILHCRSHVPMLMAAVARKGIRFRPKLLFDIRGFLPEEYVDAGVWNGDGLLFQSVKHVEAWLLKEADGYVVLTEAARASLFPESKVSGRTQYGKAVAVIPCCVDFERRFTSDPSTSRTLIRSELGIEDRLVFVHVGALGGLYLSAEMAELLATVKRRYPSTFALFLTQSDPSGIVRLLVERGFTESDYFIDKVPAADVGSYLHGSDVGISFVKSSYATRSRSPTKIPEYLASGIPVIANTGVGDVDILLKETGSGVILEGFTHEDYWKALDSVIALITNPLTADRCRNQAKSEFDLSSVGGVRYKDIYERILSSYPSDS